MTSANTDYTLVAQKIVASHADVVILRDGEHAGLRSSHQNLNPTAVQCRRYSLQLRGQIRELAFTAAIGGKNTEGLLVPNDGWWPTLKSYQNDAFVGGYLATYGGTPDDISSDTVQAFSVGQVLQQAVTRAQSLDNGNLMEQLRHGTFQSLQGPVEFSPDGQNSRAVAVLFQWRAGQLVPVYPEATAQAPMEYPKPAWP